MENNYETGKIISVQTVMHEGKINALVKKTGENNKKDAITKAVDAYLRD